MLLINKVVSIHSILIVQLLMLEKTLYNISSYVNVELKDT